MADNDSLNNFYTVAEAGLKSAFGANLALTAQVTASSESVTQGRMRAVDGIVSGGDLTRTTAAGAIALLLKK